MSKLLPTNPPARTPRSEMKVREALARVDDIVVLHSVAWQGVRRGKQADGEADFIVLVPMKGIAILEVKGGTIEVASGRWYSTDREGIQHGIKNPFEQAKDSKYALIAYLKDIDSSLSRVPIVHGVVFPDVVFAGTLGMNAPKQLVVDKNGLSDIGAGLDRLFQYWSASGEMTRAQLARISDLLAPTATLVPPLLEALETANRGIVELTQQQIETLNGLRRHRRAVILGAAGTGKTVLAVDKASRLAGEGRRVALICFNSLLRSEIANLFPQHNIEVHTFHGFVREWMRAAKLSMPRNVDDEWYRSSAVASLLEAATIVNKRYDALLIDEAQDFAPDWLDACEATVSTDGIVYAFADVRQDLYQRSWEPRSQFITFELTVNCRNTRPIAKLVASIFGEAIHDRGVDGPAPAFLAATRSSDIAILCRRTADDLLTREGLSPNQISVLSDSRDIVRQLRESMVADLPFCAAGEFGIVAETIYRFKGLEREVVIVALSSAVDVTAALELLYVGFSRARAALWVIASGETIAQLRRFDANGEVSEFSRQVSGPAK